ncbi:MAG: Modification methylase MjaII [Methanoregula sp. PtaU1.Bin051]|nr:MAG: Modification methylase MjaII [Methanoregula sp. PtaU1.Bin051]
MGVPPLWRFWVFDGDFSGLTCISGAKRGGTPHRVGEGIPSPPLIAEPLPPPRGVVGRAEGGTPPLRPKGGYPPIAPVICRLRDIPDYSLPARFYVPLRPTVSWKKVCDLAQLSGPGLKKFLSEFRGPSGTRTETDEIALTGIPPVPVYSNEFWTAGQRKASSIHEISYRACFKPQLPRFFIDLLTTRGDIVYDPFSGRGTTVIEAALCGRKIIANDANPLSRIMTEPRLAPPRVINVEERLATIPRDGSRADCDLSMFYHKDTEREIVALREYLLERRREHKEDVIDRWIAMVATNRLTGHSSGFFSVYTLPPNQAVSPESQKRINRRRNQKPGYRDTHKLILKKTKSLLSGLNTDQIRNLNSAAKTAVFLTCDAGRTEAIPDSSVHLTATSPPFLDIVQYREDNWLRCWFNGLDTDVIGKGITMARTVRDWTGVMQDVFDELYRITRPGGRVAFEVGEVRKGTIRLEEEVIPLGTAAGFSCEAVMINSQEFTKTSHIWGVANMGCGTNTNRIVMFRKPAG